MATTSLGRLTIDMVMKTAAFQQGMDKAGRKTKQTTTQMSKDAQQASEVIKAAFSSVSKAAAGALGAFSVGSVFMQIINNTKAMEHEQAQLAAVLRSTGEAAGFNRDQLNGMAQAIADNSMFSAGEITKGQTALLAFTGIMGEEFVRAQQAAADMAARTGSTVTSAMETIGRALDVPSKGLTALSKQGFKFTEEQGKLALYLEATGKKAEAQGIILQALEESYGGAAKAARETFGGAMVGLQNTIGNLTTGQEGSLEGARLAVERLNTTLASPETSAAIGALTSTAIEGFELLVRAITAVPWEYTTHAVVALSAVVAGRLVGSLTASGAAFVVNTNQAIRYQMALASMASVSTTAAAGMTALGAAATVASRALALVGGPFGALVIAGVAAYAIFRDNSKATDEYKTSLENMQGPIEEVTKRLHGMTKAQREASLERVKLGIGEAAEEERKSVAALQSFLVNDLPDAARGSKGEIATLSMELQKSMGNTTTMLTTLEAAVAAGTVPESVLSSVRMLASNVDDARQKIEAGETRVVEISSALANMEGNARGAAGGVKELTEEFLNAQAAGAQYLASLAKGNITAGIKTELGRFEALLKSGQIAFASEDQENEARAAAALRDRLTASTQRVKAPTDKAAEAFKNLADRLLPLEKISRDFETDQGMLNKALDSGKITIDQYTLAMHNLNQQRDTAVRNLIPEEVKRLDDLRRTSEAGIETLRIQQERALEGMGKSDRWNELSNALASVEDRYRGIAEQMAASTAGISEEDLEALRGYKEQELAIIQEYHDKKVALEDSYQFGLQQGMQSYVDSVGTASEQMANLTSTALKSVEDTLFDFITTGDLNLGDMIRNLGQSVVRMMIQTGLQMAVNFAMSKMFSTAAAATSAATGTAMATAYAPAAALASLASFGGNSIPAMAGIASTAAMTEGLAFAGMFDDGGNIGSGQWGIVGEFGPELVKGPANVTSREDTMRMLRNNQGSDGNGDVIVQFYGDPNQVASVEQDTDEFGRRVIRVMMQDWMSGGEFGSTLQATSNLRRAAR